MKGSQLAGRSRATSAPHISELARRQIELRADQGVRAPRWRREHWLQDTRCQCWLQGTEYESRALRSKKEVADLNQSLPPPPFEGAAAGGGALNASMRSTTGAAGAACIIHQRSMRTRQRSSIQQQGASVAFRTSDVDTASVNATDITMHRG